MRHKKVIKFTLLGLSALVLVTIGISFYLNTGQFGSKAIEFLERDIAQMSRDVEHLDYDGSDAVFKVESDVTTLSSEGIQALTGVKLHVFRPKPNQGKDLVVANQAKYLKEERLVQFENDVLIQLEDQTQILADALVADIGQKTLAVDGQFRFQRKNVMGSGAKLSYVAAERRLLVEGGLDVIASDLSGETSITAQQLEYLPDASKLSFTKGFRLISPRGEITSDRTSLYMNAENQLTRFLAELDVEFVSPERTARGSILDIDFEPESGAIRSFRIDASDTSLAELTQKTGGKSQSIKGKSIQATPSQQPLLETLVFESIRVSGEVSLKWPAAGIDSLTAGGLWAKNGSGQGFRELDFIGGVDFKRTSFQGPEYRETLTAERLQLRMDDLGAIQSLRAQGYPSIHMARTPQSVSVNAETELSFNFKEGALARMETWGNSTLKEVTQNGTLQIDASSFDIAFLDGSIKKCTARGPVETLRASKSGEQVSRCEYLEVDYASSGQINRIVQTGNVEISQTGKENDFTLTAEKAVLDNDKSVLVLSGKPTLKRFNDEGELLNRTDASGIIIGVADYRMEASGPVLSIFKLEETEGSITAGNMRTEGDAGRIIYTGRPLLHYGENKIESDNLEIDPNLKGFVASGSVTSQFVMTTEEGVVLNQIIASSLEIDSANKKALFSGDVVATTERWTIRAPTVELYFEGPNLETLNRVHSAGGIEIEGGKRSAKGDTADYFPKENKVVVYGNDARIIDPGRGKAIGRKLTFYLGDDRLLIEGP